jgi:hypothetical protein
MNIFEIYCGGEGRINETNMSSVLGYLLSPYASHGFGKESLNSFLEPLADEIKILCDNKKLKLAGKNFHPDKLADQLGKVKIEFEKDVYGKSVTNNEITKKREIDLLIRFEGDENKQKLIIAIENKISDGSSTDLHQLKEEYLFLRSEIDETEGCKDTPIIFVYLTPKLANSRAPQSEKLWTQLDCLSCKPDAQQSDFKVNYTWHMHDEGAKEKSITQLALNLLESESRGRINPASSHATLMLKSLIKFIDNGFRINEEVFGAEPVDNGMRLKEVEEFWTIWREKKSSTYMRANESFDVLRSTMEEKLLQFNKSENELIVKTRASTTRMSLFFDDPQTPVNLTKKKLSNRPIALFFNGMTTSSRIQVQFARRPWVTVKQFADDLNDEVLAKLVVQTEPQHNTHTTMFIDMGLPFEKLKPLLVAAATEATKSVFED